MKGIDHKRLGLQIAAQFPANITFLERKIFVAGCVLPDRNMFTYLRGCIRSRKIRGHHYQNVKKIVKKDMERLSNKTKWKKGDYYHLGKLLHYVTDAFTFPHNEEFRGNLKEHVEYEKKFHFLLEENVCLLGGRQPVWVKQKNGTELFECFEREHTRYLKMRESMWDDLKYIYQMASLVFDLVI